MEWTVENHDAFDSEFLRLPEDIQDEILALSKLLCVFGPNLKRPHADTLNGSSHSNMKELRFEAGDGVWRVAYAFDPSRKAIILVAGDKSGVNQKRFYKMLIAKADARFSQHLAQRTNTQKGAR
jgi:hypothetical protein